MELSNSTVKLINKPQLYFSKYLFKASIQAEGIFWTRFCKNYEDFEDRPKHMVRPLDVVQSLKDEETVKHILELRNGLKGADVRFRYDYSKFSLYSSDESLIKRLIDSNHDWEVEQVQPNPEGIIYFAKKNPPGKYRTYFTYSGPKHNEEIIDYLGKTPDLKPSSRLRRHLFFVKGFVKGRRSWRHHVWTINNCYVDYDDERQLMMMKLLFSEVVGKTYKLEKKPS